MSCLVSQNFINFFTKPNNWKSLLTSNTFSILCNSGSSSYMKHAFLYYDKDVSHIASKNQTVKPCLYLHVKTLVSRQDIGWALAEDFTITVFIPSVKTDCQELVLEDLK